MSNRLIQIGRVPLIPDPDIAIKASQVFSNTQAQMNQVIELGNAYLGLWSNLRNSFRRFSELLDRASEVRNLSTMSDKSLADIGIRRDQLPQLYRDANFGDIAGRRVPQRPNDRER